jgi:hypothetical protein
MFLVILSSRMSLATAAASSNRPNTLLLPSVNAIVFTRVICPNDDDFVQEGYFSNFCGRLRITSHIVPVTSFANVVWGSDAEILRRSLFSRHPNLVKTLFCVTEAGDANSIGRIRFIREFCDLNLEALIRDTSYVREATVPHLMSHAISGIDYLNRHCFRHGHLTSGKLLLRLENDELVLKISGHAQLELIGIQFDILDGIRLRNEDLWQIGKIFRDLIGFIQPQIPPLTPSHSTHRGDYRCLRLSLLLPLCDMLVGLPVPENPAIAEPAYLLPIFKMFPGLDDECSIFRFLYAVGDELRYNRSLADAINNYVDEIGRNDDYFRWSNRLEYSDDHTVHFTDWIIPKSDNRDPVGTGRNPHRLSWMAQVFRHKAAHYLDLSAATIRALSPFPLQYVRMWLTRFPDMLYHLWTPIARDPWLRSLFLCHFPIAQSCSPGPYVPLSDAQRRALSRIPPFVLPGVNWNVNWDPVPNPSHRASIKPALGEDC